MGEVSYRRIGNRARPSGVEMDVGWTRSWPTCICIAALFAHALAAQSGPPRFTLPQRFLQPGQFLEIYGTDLAASPGCSQSIPSSGPYPVEACGVRVTANGLPAGLLYVGPIQVNVKLPENVPDGPAPVQICVRDVCSDPVVKEFSSHKAFVHVQEPAYVQMPIWVDVELPSQYRISYPCRTDPWDFRSPGVEHDAELVDYKLELLREGMPVAESSPPARNFESGSPNGPDCMVWMNGLSRLPLHLAYKIDSPGKYSIRLTGTHGSEMVVQSAWTDFELNPSSERMRDEWLRSVAQRASSAEWNELLRDVIPSLMAWPDAKALRVLLPLYLEWLRPRGLMNQQIHLAAFLRNSLGVFDDSLLRSVVPASSLAVICPPQGNCRDSAQR